MARTCDLNDEFRKGITEIVIAEPYPGFYTYHKKQNQVLITNGVLVRVSKLFDGLSPVSGHII